MTIREALYELLKDKFAFDLRLGTVVPGSVSGGFCQVVPFDTEDENGNGSPMPNVRLQSNSGNGIILTPADGSVVVIGKLIEPDYCVLLYSSLVNIQMLDGSYGGLVEVANLTSKLNNLENKVNNIISVFNTHVHTGVVTGSGSSATTPTLISGTLTPTNRGDIENTKITHGSP